MSVSEENKRSSIRSWSRVEIFLIPCIQLPVPRSEKLFLSLGDYDPVRVQFVDEHHGTLELAQSDARRRQPDQAGRSQVWEQKLFE